MRSKILFVSRVTLVLSVLSCSVRAFATENAPHAPFAEWADVPARGQLVAGLFYQESEAYHIWAGDTQYDVNWRSHGEEYGIDINQGYLTLQYGINDRWAADLAIGYTTAAWRYFSNDGNTNGG